MIKHKGLVHPNGKAINELRTAYRWSVEKLAEVAGIDPRSADRAEQGDRVQYAKIEAIARALRMDVKDIIINELDDEATWPTHSRIQVHKDWEPSWLAIALAQREVLIVDSFFSEFAHLGTVLGRKAAQRNKPLSLCIYMASPRKEFGAQRTREKDLPDDDETNLFPLLVGPTTKKERKDYKTNFHLFEVGIKQHSGRHNVSVAVFEYVCMPSLRIIVVDQTHFFFGWFPLAGQNPGHICLYLRNEGLNAADVELREKLTRHINRVKRLSAPAMQKQ